MKAARYVHVESTQRGTGVISKVSACAFFFANSFGGLEVVYKRGNVVLVFLDISLFCSTSSLLGQVSHYFLKMAILLWANLLKNLRHQLFELLSFGSTVNNKKVFLNGEINYSKKRN